MKFIWAVFLLMSLAANFLLFSWRNEEIKGRIAAEGHYGTVQKLSDELSKQQKWKEEGLLYVQGMAQDHAAEVLRLENKIQKLENQIAATRKTDASFEAIKESPQSPRLKTDEERIADSLESIRSSLFMESLR